METRDGRRATAPTPDAADRDERPIEETRASFESAGEETLDGILDAVRQALRERLVSSSPLRSGGMGSVEVVRDRVLERTTVLKRIHAHLSADPASLHMFVREAQITGQLEHPNIVPVHELGLQGERSLYFTMKLVEGRTLSEIIAELPEGPLDHDTLLDLVDLVIRVCDALAFAHSRGILHLDVKPSNVMVGDFGQVYLMDWGIARRRGEPAPPQPEDPSGRGQLVVVGTATHMAPEQARGLLHELDDRTDVFAVGALLYHVLTREPPYRAETFLAALVRAQCVSFTPLEELAPHVPRALARIVARAMAASPDDRHPSVAALRHDLQQFARGGGLFAAVHVPKGETIVRQGEPGATAYIIEHGSLEVSRVDDGERRVLRVMGPGEVFGEMAILAPGPRTASVTALEPSTLRVVTAETLEREVESLKPWMGALVRTLATRFREREERDRVG